MLDADKKRSQAKELFKHTYDENPSGFKQSFKKAVNERILELINKERHELTKQINTKM